MYKVPLSFNTDSLKGEQIFQVAFGLNFITLFINKGHIQFSGSFSIEINNQIFCYNEVYPVSNDFGLLKLLEKIVVSVNVDDSRKILTLEFEDGIILRLIGNDEYESYRVKIGTEEFIV